MTNPPDHLQRSQVADAAADALEWAVRFGLKPALVGFDGFIDAIIDVVDQRRDMSAAGYSRFRTIQEFAIRAASAAGKSSNMELVVKEERFGGNGPLLAGALGQLGMPVTYIGAVGREDNPRELHPLYAELKARCRAVIPLAPPAHTDALEFDDGKIMLGKPANVQSITWDMLVTTVGLESLLDLVGSCALIGIVNWVMMGGVEGIWSGLCRDVLPRLAKTAPDQRRFFIDLADPAKRTDTDILRALSILREVSQHAPVTLGLNLSEAQRLSAVLGVNAFAEGGMGTLGSVVKHGAAAIRELTALDCVVIHPREGAGAVDARGHSAWFEGPFTSTPKLSTGAGDHFNGGFALGQVHGLSLDQCLAVGCAVSGAYVRDARSPTLARVVEFLRDLPVPESH